MTDPPKRRRQSTPFPHRPFTDERTGRPAIFPEKAPSAMPDAPDSDRAVNPEEDAAAMIHGGPATDRADPPDFTNADIMTELRMSRQDIVTKIAGVSDRVTNVTDIVLNALPAISDLGARALDIEQTIYAAAAMLRTAAEIHRDDDPQLVRHKTKLLVVAQTLGRIAPRKAMDPEPGMPQLERGPKDKRRGG